MLENPNIVSAEMSHIRFKHQTSSILISDEIIAPIRDSNKADAEIEEIFAGDLSYMDLDERNQNMIRK